MSKNKPDAIKMDVPLFIRMLEYAREDAKTDMDLHVVTEKLVGLMTNDNTTLTMDNYNHIVGGKKTEPTEQMSDASGSFEGPMQGTPVIKRPINEQGVLDSGQYDVPYGGGPKGRKNPLKIDGPDKIKDCKAIKDKNFPKWGGPGAVFVKIKDKCKKFPYCNQGDINAIEVLREVIEEVSKNNGIPKEVVEKIILKEIKDIFI